MTRDCHTVHETLMKGGTVGGEEMKEREFVFYAKYTDKQTAL